MGRDLRKHHVAPLVVENTSKIVLVSLAKGLIGPEAATLLGGLFFAELWQAVLARAAGYLIIPEPATGLDGGTEVEVVLYR